MRHAAPAAQLQHQGELCKLRLEVAHTGMGITPEAQQRIFEPFTQGDASTTRCFGGTGLGLSIVQRLVDMMGGTFTLQSAEGQSSTFTFTLTLRVPAGSKAQSGSEGAW